MAVFKFANHIINLLENKCVALEVILDSTTAYASKIYEYLVIKIWKKWFQRNNLEMDIVILIKPSTKSYESWN